MIGPEFDSDKNYTADNLVRLLALCSEVVIKDLEHHIAVMNDPARHDDNIHDKAFDRIVIFDTTADERTDTLAGVALYFLDHDGNFQHGQNDVITDISEFTADILKKLCKERFYITTDGGDTKTHFSVNDILQIDSSKEAPQGPALYHGKQYTSVMNPFPVNGRDFYKKYYNNRAQ